MISIQIDQNLKAFQGWNVVWCRLISDGNIKVMCSTTTVIFLWLDFEGFSVKCLTSRMMTAHLMECFPSGLDDSWHFSAKVANMNDLGVSLLTTASTGRFLQCCNTWLDPVLWSSWHREVEIDNAKQLHIFTKFEYKHHRNSEFWRKWWPQPTNTSPDMEIYSKKNQLPSRH